MRKILAVAMLAAMTALGGRAEDPKQESPFREFKKGDVKYESTDKRLSITDLRIEQGDSWIGVAANCKNLTENSLSGAGIEMAFFDADQRLLRTGYLQFKGSRGFTSDIDSRAASSGSWSCAKGDLAAAKSWQFIVRVEDGK